MELDNVGEVIAERRYVLSTRNGKSEVILRIGMPKPFPDGNGYYAPFAISGLGPAKIRYSAGVDAIQALQGALKMAGVNLHFYRRGHGTGCTCRKKRMTLAFPVRRGRKGWRTRSYLPSVPFTA